MSSSFTLKKTAYYSHTAHVCYRCNKDAYGRLSDEKLQRLIMEYGGVETGMRAGDRSFQSLSAGGGVYDQCTSDALDHAVVVVGWGEEWSYSTQYGRQMLQKYWLVRNSWGQGWGDGGYVKIKRGTCGVGTVSVH